MSMTGHGTVARSQNQNTIKRDEISHDCSSFFCSVSLFRAVTRINIPTIFGSRTHTLSSTPSNLAGMILKSYTKSIDGTIPVQALLYDDEQLLGSQEGVGIYDG